MSTARVGTGALARPSRARRGPRQARCWLAGVEQLGSRRRSPQVRIRDKRRILRSVIP
jgi:hypothetical protein